MLKRIFMVIAMLAALIANASSSRADGPFEFTSEVLFTRLHTSLGYPDLGKVNFDPAGRYSIAKIGANNLGFRVTYFDFKTDINSPPVREFLDTYNLDFEAFKRINLTEFTRLELSGGLRYNDTEHFFANVNDPSDFTGFGGLVGGKVGARVGDCGLLYTRIKFALLGGKGDSGANILGGPVNVYGTTRAQTEIALGYQHSLAFGNAIITPHLGAEWQHWQGFHTDPVDDHAESDLMLAAMTTGIRIDF